MILVDYSCVANRHITGLERITQELFGPGKLGSLSVQYVSAASAVSILAAQLAVLPMRAALNRSATVVCPGFPPSLFLSLIAGRRTIPYIHDLFLIERPQDLSLRAKIYLAPAFRYVVTQLKTFFVNSETTGKDLRRYCRSDARICLFRPPVDNIFRLSDGARRFRDPFPPSFRIVAIGTVEPRKNYGAAAHFREALEASLGKPVELHIVGRRGWGDAYTTLEGKAGVILHGYLDAEAVRRLVDEADLAICTSHAEGLGLPLLELQYAGIPVIASNIPVFCEVLRNSGILINMNDPAGAAAKVVTELAVPDWRAKHVEAAQKNLVLWNELAATDKDNALRLLEELS